MPTHPWRTLRTPNLEIAIHWPGGRVPASLIVDDPMPGLNPMVDHEPSHPHRPHIPNAVLHRFADLAERHGLQGKFSVVPWPLALGRLDRPTTLPAESRKALPEFIGTVRARIVPRFDITCEFLTHSRAIDTRTETPLPETERLWASRATAEAFADTIALAARMLADTGLPMEGVTSPWDSGADNETAYAQGIALAEARRGRHLSWYFLRFSDGLDVLPRIAHHEGRSIVVSILAGAGTDPGWRTQYGEAPRTDALLNADGRGRVAELVEAGLPVVFCTHWQSLYGNGSLGGLHAIDVLGARVREHFGGRVDWVPLRRHAEMAAACATLEASEVDLTETPHRSGVESGDGGNVTRGHAVQAALPAARGSHSDTMGVRLATPYPLAVADVVIRGLTQRGRDWVAQPLTFNATPLDVRTADGGAMHVRMPLCRGVLASGAGRRGHGPDGATAVQQSGHLGDGADRRGHGPDGATAVK